MVIVSADTPTQQALIGLRNRLSFDDFLAVRERVRGIDSITAMMQPPSFGGRVKQGSHSTVTQILGTDSNYQDVVRVYTDQGRIGRASGRERVCQYVEILVVAGSLKKKVD